MGKILSKHSHGKQAIINSKLHQVILTEDSPISREPALLTVNSIVKASKQGKFSMFLINNTHKHIQLRKGSTIGKIEK